MDNLNRIVSPLCQLVADIKTTSMEELLRQVLKEDTPTMDTLEKKPNTDRRPRNLSEVLEVECELKCLSAACSVRLKLTPNFYSFNIAACPNEALALTNRLIVHPSDFPEGVDYVRLKGKYILGIQ